MIGFKKPQTVFIPNSSLPRRAGFDIRSAYEVVILKHGKK